MQLLSESRIKVAYQSTEKMPGPNVVICPGYLYEMKHKYQNIDLNLDLDFVYSYQNMM